jgi:hypothetical protein
MRVHVIYFCPRCGCQSFRPSAARIARDSILRMLGVRPQRCYICKVRFYLFQPAILRTLASPIETRASPGLKAPPLRPGMPDLLT